MLKMSEPLTLVLVKRVLHSMTGTNFSLRIYWHSRPRFGLVEMYFATLSNLSSVLRKT